MARYRSDTLTTDESGFMRAGSLISPVNKNNIELDFAQADVAEGMEQYCDTDLSITSKRKGKKNRNSAKLRKTINKKDQKKSC